MVTPLQGGRLVPGRRALRPPQWQPRPSFRTGRDNIVFDGLVILAILLCAALLGPDGPNGPADPTLIRTVPRPDFYFLSLFALFALLPSYTERF
jgi:hypothetical protein